MRYNESTMQSGPRKPLRTWRILVPYYHPTTVSLGVLYPGFLGKHISALTNSGDTHGPNFVLGFSCHQLPKYKLKYRSSSRVTPAPPPAPPQIAYTAFTAACVRTAVIPRRRRAVVAGIYKPISNASLDRYVTLILIPLALKPT